MSFLGVIRITPTRHSAYFALVITAMGIASVNYQSNAAWLLVFLVLSIGLVSALHAWLNLGAIEVAVAPPAPVAAGEPLRLAVSATNPGDRPAHSIRIELPTAFGIAGGVDIPLVPAGGAGCGEVLLPGLGRGVWTLRGFTVSTAYPLGLAKAWREADAAGEVVVFPRPDGDPLGDGRPTAPGNARRGSWEGDEDFAGHREHRDGDSSRRIDWKASERLGRMLVKVWTGGGAEAVLLHWDEARGATEERLSQLARWVLDADRRGVPYGLQLPSAVIAPATGAPHHAACLRALAAHPRDGAEP